MDPAYGESKLARRDLSGRCGFCHDGRGHWRRRFRHDQPRDHVRDNPAYDSARHHGQDGPEQPDDGGIHIKVFGQPAADSGDF